MKNSNLLHFQVSILNTYNLLIYMIHATKIIHYIIFSLNRIINYFFYIHLNVLNVGSTHVLQFKYLHS